VSALSSAPAMRAPSEGLVSPVLLSPSIALLCGAFLFPLGQVLVLSFVPPQEGMSVWANFQRFFADDYYLSVAYRTLRLSAIIALVCVLVGFPLAYAISKASRRLRLFLLIVTVLPLMTSVVIRTFGWMIVFGRGGVLSDMLRAIGVPGSSSVLLHTETGLVIAMVQVMLPFMVLTTLGVINSIHPHLEEASRTMGAGFYRTLSSVMLPLSMPGITSGAILVFTLSISSFVTPSLVGGVRLPVIAGAIYQEATRNLDWGFAAAQSTLLLTGAMVLLLPYFFITGGRRG
jgi:putative spermidine/putrescine transport system permease protein